MFSFFKKNSPSPQYTDKVWKRSQYARKGMLMMAMMKFQQGKPSIIISFFKSEMDELIADMHNYQLDYVLLNESTALDLIKPVIYFLHTDDIKKVSVSVFLKHNVTSFSNEVYSPSHYPINNIESDLLNLLAADGYKKFTFCLSFEDPLLKMFASENLLPLLEKLGLEEEEAIEHAMVTQSIKRARQKLDDSITQEKKATSPKEWFELNVKR